MGRFSSLWMVGVLLIPALVDIMGRIWIPQLPPSGLRHSFPQLLGVLAAEGSPLRQPGPGSGPMAWSHLHQVASFTPHGCWFERHSPVNSLQADLHLWVYFQELTQTDAAEIEYWGQKQSSTITNLILPKAGYLKDQGSDCAGLQLRLMAYQLCGLAPFLSGVILSSFLTFPMAVIALPMPT